MQKCSAGFIMVPECPDQNLRSVCPDLCQKSPLAKEINVNNAFLFLLSIFL